MFFLAWDAGELKVGFTFSFVVTHPTDLSASVVAQALCWTIFNVSPNTCLLPMIIELVCVQISSKFNKYEFLNEFICMNSQKNSWRCSVIYLNTNSWVCPFI